MPFLSDIRAMLLAGLFAVTLAVSVVQTVRIEGFGIWPLKIHGLEDKYQAAINKLVAARAELKRISSAKNEQREETGKRIEEADNGIREADRRAREIEDAPTQPDCRTPPEIMGADL